MGLPDKSRGTLHATEKVRSGQVRGWKSRVMVQGSGVRISHHNKVCTLHTLNIDLKNLEWGEWSLKVPGL